ncbi:MAG: hypothetical protein CR975_05570 [Gammaproteobacteria bacterium]|nr:MAG: hypothetical protein CR975_05570 [Gammaproteobacteria bacterium]
MKKIYLLSLSAAMILWSCQTSQHDIAGKQRLHWQGIYNGFLPCASCPGIVTTIKLNHNKTFAKTDLYLGEKGGYFSKQGTFSFTEDGKHIVIKPKTGGKTMYAVEENRLIMLNEAGEKSTSELATMYKLNKAADAEVVFSDKPIKGLLTFGHEVSTFRPCASLTTYWLKDFPDGQLTKHYQQKLGLPSTPPYTPVLAELVVKNTGKAEQGFAAQYAGVLQALKLNSLELLSPQNHCGK